MSSVPKPVIVTNVSLGPLGNISSIWISVLKYSLQIKKKKTPEIFVLKDESKSFVFKSADNYNLISSWKNKKTKQQQQQKQPNKPHFLVQIIEMDQGRARKKKNYILIIVAFLSLFSQV